MSADCEQRLVEQARLNAEAFRRLYNLYLPRLYAYVVYRVGGVQDAADLVSEVFLKVAEELGSFQWRHDNSFAAWLFRIAHNLINNFHRDTQRAGVALPLDDLPQIAADGLLPEDALLRKEVFAHLHALVISLPPRRREVITLKYFGGLRNQEIAAVLGLDERTVASNLSRALDDLQVRTKSAELVDVLGSKPKDVGNTLR